MTTVVYPFPRDTEGEAMIGPNLQKDIKRRKANAPKPTITEFLLARIDGKERGLERLEAAMEHDDYWVPGCVVNAGGLLSPTQVRAECKAHSFIVRQHRPSRCACSEWPCPTIRALASVYADHPDYQQEWRP